ncbi:MAG: carboxypeptidase regulatory-like domain-containing protein, partial [Opitutaceae bacterium]|nr:carboxypeptidase regulatory-like domain-containing protein [Opitutaceae bacterium]
MHAFFPVAGRFVCRLASFIALGAVLFAQPSGPVTGAVSGVVTNAQGEFLQGAVVRLDGTERAATTDRSGRFRLVDVPVGIQRVAASYLGLADAVVAVTVTGSGEAEVNLALKPAGEAVVLERFVVESIVEGQARAVNRQRASDTIQNIIAADALGRLPDASVGEALARLPGISVQVDRGEPDKIAVRGLSPKYNNVSLNGGRIPAVFDSTEVYDNRSVSLNTVPTDLIS